MSKGSARRPGKGYEEGWERIWGATRYDKINLAQVAEQERHMIDRYEKARAEFEDNFGGSCSLCGGRLRWRIHPQGDYAGFYCGSCRKYESERPSAP